jgi:hypothetical protein
MATGAHDIRIRRFDATPAQRRLLQEWLAADNPRKLGGL